jgi:hypothetical protein
MLPQETLIPTMHERHAYTTVHTKLQDSLLLIQACPVMAFVKCFCVHHETNNILKQRLNIFSGIKHENNVKII